MISSFSVHHTQYADDTQLYIEILKEARKRSLPGRAPVVHREWSRSQSGQVGTGARIRQEGRIDVMTLGSALITVSDSVKSLGVTIDETLSFNTHVNNVCKAS